MKMKTEQFISEYEQFLIDPKKIKKYDDPEEQGLNIEQFTLLKYSELKFSNESELKVPLDCDN